MGRFAALLVYVCLGTMMAQAVILGYVWMNGSLDKQKLARMIDVARGTEVPVVATAEKTTEKTAAKTAEPPEQPSLDDLERQRGVKARHLELREQSVQDGLERIRFEQRKLASERDDYEQLKRNFEKLLSKEKTSIEDEGRNKVRQLWENISPEQAKEQILQMIDAGEQNDVVLILSSIAIRKQAKIIEEFKNDDEKKKLEEIVELIRKGVPEVTPIDQAREKIKQFNPKKA